MKVLCLCVLQMLLCVSLGFAQSNSIPQPGFKTIIPLAPVNNLTDETKDKPQAKTWIYAGKWWSVLSVTGGTKLFRLDGTAWTEILQLTFGKSKPDCWVAGNLVHLLIYKGSFNNTYLYTLQYDEVKGTYKLWDQRPTGTILILPEGAQTATLVMDSKGRIWTAADGINHIRVWYSDAPYTSWKGPVTIANNVDNDDMCTLLALPALGKIGIFWSNQVTERFGFKTHNDGADADSWSADELPAAASARDNIGGGMADNHMSAKVAADGTVYVASKTSYDTTGFPKLLLLVRRPGGNWDAPYPITTYPEGTQPCLLLNEIKNTIRVVYSSIENGSDILYRASSTVSIAFSASMPLIKTPGLVYNFATSTHQNYGSSVVILATNMSVSPNQAISVLASDDELVIDSTGSPVIKPVVTGDPTVLKVYPNPSNGTANIRLRLPFTSSFNLTLYDSRGRKVKTLREGKTLADTETIVPLNGNGLPPAVYYIRLHAGIAVTVKQIIIQH
ncbi:hypothetical protein BH10BAC3_BH10BAC3_09150 [soil metagenome]